MNKKQLLEQAVQQASPVQKKALAKPLQKKLPIQKSVQKTVTVQKPVPQKPTQQKPIVYDRMTLEPEVVKKILKAAPQTKESESYFVSIKSPLELRKQLLEAAKKSLFALQNYERILLIRQRKLKEMAELKDSIKELQYLNKKFNDKLPKYYHELLSDPKVIKNESESALIKVVSPKIEKPAVKVKREKTEIEKLEDSLSAIEGKLKRLQ